MSYLQEDLLLLANKAKELGFTNKTFVISGATGLIGSLLIKALLCCNDTYGANNTIIALARSEEKAKALFASAYDRADVQWVYQDIAMPLPAFEKVDYIVHTANSTASKYFITNPVETIDSIYAGSKNILELAKQHPESVTVYLSSMEVFGVVEASEERVREKQLGYLDLTSVRSCYSEGKRLVECMIKAYAEEYGVNVKIARLAQTFGAGILPGENRVFAQFAKSALQGQDIVLHTKGDSFGNYCYTRDALNAILLLLTAGENGEAYTVVNESSTMTIADMAALVAKTLGGGKSKVVFDIPQGNVFGYAPKTQLRLSSEKLNALGWQAEVSMEESYTRMVESL